MGAKESQANTGQGLGLDPALAPVEQVPKLRLWGQVPESKACGDAHPEPHALGPPALQLQGARPQPRTSTALSP